MHPGGGPWEPDAEMREILEQVMVARLSKELALDDEQTVLLVRQFSGYRERVHELQKQHSELVKDLKASVEEGTDGQAIEDKLEAIMAHDEKILSAQREVYELAGGELTAWQRAKLYIFITDFQGEMRNLIRRARERHQGFGEGGPRRGGRMGMGPGPGKRGMGGMGQPEQDAPEMPPTPPEDAPE